MKYVGNVLVIASGVIAGSIELFTGGNISHIIWPFLAAAWAAMEMIK
ncbi:TMhelix containing protein [Vibrio phage 1.243.O._10N.261.54.B5]|nr:TMhelix containing protein [Vibrio phage 1.243.O._10N.261.54.B5]